MLFKIRQKMFSFGDAFTITDREDRERYQVQGKVFSLGNKLTLCDMEGEAIYYIEQQLMRLMAEYYIYQGERQVVTCKKRFALFGSKFDITSDHGNYAVEGHPLDYSYKIHRDGELVATVDKQFFSFTDTYGVQVMDSEDEAFILSLVIVIDQVVHDNDH